MIHPIQSSPIHASILNFYLLQFPFFVFNPTPTMTVESITDSSNQPKLITYNAKIILKKTQERGRQFEKKE